MMVYISKQFRMWIALAFMVAQLLSCASPTEKAPIHAHEHEGHDHFQDGTEPTQDPLTVSCEHDMLAYECDNCRFEVGVVKVDPHLLDPQDEGHHEPMVKTVPVTQRELSHEIALTGEIALNANRTAHISSTVVGTIGSVMIDLGHHVKLGDVLFTVNSVELGQAMNEYQRNAALMALAERNLQRETRLHQQKISSERDVIDAQMAFEELRTAWNASRHALQVLGVREGQIQASSGEEPTQASRLDVRTPIHGTVVQQHVVAGERIHPDEAVVMISDLNTLWAWFNIYEQDLSALLKREAVDQPIPLAIRVASFPELTFHGTVDYIGATMDEATRTVKIRAEVDNSQRLLRPGMFCQAAVQVDTSDPVLAIPQTSLLSDEGQSFVFAHMNDNLFIRRVVHTGRHSRGFVEVLEGLSLDDLVVVDGAFLLKSDVLREKMGAGCAD